MAERSWTAKKDYWQLIFFFLLVVEYAMMMQDIWKDCDSSGLAAKDGSGYDVNHDLAKHSTHSYVLDLLGASELIDLDSPYGYHVLFMTGRILAWGRQVHTFMPRLYLATLAPNAMNDLHASNKSCSLSGCWGPRSKSRRRSILLFEGRGSRRRKVV